MNVVMLSKHDYAGSGWQIVQAVRRHTRHNIVHVKTTSHKHGYKTDYILDGKNRAVVQGLVDKADVVHFKGDDLPSRDWYGVKIPEKVKIILTVGGSFFRRNGRRTGLRPIEEYVKRSDFRTALSPDLNYDEFKSVYTPYLIDSEKAEYSWKEDRDGKFVIGCYPGVRKEKGFESVVEPAWRQLEKEGYKFEKVLTIGMTYEQSVGAKKGMSIFIDQISLAGCYGNSALEAMQFGIPVVAYIGDVALKHAMEEFKKSPIMNPGKTKEGLYLLLKRILSRKIDLSDISKKTKCYCDGFHSYTVGARIWNEIYEKVASKNV